MIKVLFTILALFFTFKLFSEKGVDKLKWFFAGILLFPHKIVLIQNPIINFPRLLIIVFFISSLNQYGKSFFKEFKLFPLKNALMLLLFALLLIGMNDASLAPFLKIYRPFIYYLEYFLILFLSYLHIRDIEDVWKIYSFITTLFILFCIYGISNLLTGHNEYNQLIIQNYPGFDIANAYTEGRFRVSSFTWHPIYYGLLLCFVILINLFRKNNYRIKPKRNMVINIILVLLVVNLFLTNSRTPLLALLVGGFIYLLFALRMQKKIMIAVGCIGAFFIISSYFPENAKFINETLNTITFKESSIEGSSFEMRQDQLAASLIEYNRSPIYGNGFGYIGEKLTSWKEDNMNNNNFYNFESYVYVLLIEQGLCGIIGNVFLFLSLAYFLLRRYKSSNFFGKRLILLNFSLLVSFLLFIIGTGDLLSFPFCMAIMGINMKGIMLSQKSIEEPSIQLKPSYAL